MNIHTPIATTLADVARMVECADLSATRRRDMVSGISRICAMMGYAPQSLPANAPDLRMRLAKILPAAHGVSTKTFANLKSLFASGLELASIIDPMPHGLARRDPRWGPLVKAIGHDKRLKCGLATFSNWCVSNHVPPEAVTDERVRQFQDWLETRTLYAQCHNLVRRVPNIWNETAQAIAGWPQSNLTPVSFRTPSEHLTWEELNPDFRHDAERYLASRENPDLFDERPNAPRRPLARTTLRLQRAHLRLAASILMRQDKGVDEITALAELVDPDAFTSVLRHYHDKAEGKANAFAIGVAKTLQQIAKYHVGLNRDQLDRLKALAAKLPSVPFDLTEKNKTLLRQLESEHMRARLVSLPLDLLAGVRDGLDQDRFLFVDAQVAAAVDVALIAPLRPQNLSALNWGQHFHEPDGSKGRLLLRIPAQETKTKQRELVFELPDDVANRLRWYRRDILPRLGSDPNGYLFVTHGGALKDQKTLASQITRRIEQRVGLHMTPHQFRHVAASFYLRAHPEDFRTVTDLLGHSSAKTTLIYAGVSSERASRVYTNFVLEQREALKLKGRKSRASRVKRKGARP